MITQTQAAVSQSESIKVAAQTVDLLTRVNEVQVASRPEGLSKRTLVGTTTLLGFFIGLGLILLFTESEPRPLAQFLTSAVQPSTTNAAVVTDPPTARATVETISPRETVDQILERGSFAVTVMPSNYLLSKPYAE